ncbi:hypothetical protein G7Y79_00018g046010 [Physcia stellaris]|nr:hypothetical protein G7Y79_00018g046010 [Physcia stellaris]
MDDSLVALGRDIGIAEDIEVAKDSEIADDTRAVENYGDVLRLQDVRPGVSGMVGLAQDNGDVEEDEVADDTRIVEDSDDVLRLWDARSGTSGLARWVRLVVDLCSVAGVWTGMWDFLLGVDSRAIQASVIGISDGMCQKR